MVLESGLGQSQRNLNLADRRHVEELIVAAQEHFDQFIAGVAWLLAREELVRLEVSDPVDDDDIASRSIWIDTEVRSNISTRLASNRCKSKLPLWIARQYEIDPTRAQDAFAIKNDQSATLRAAGQPRC